MKKRYIPGDLQNKIERPELNSAVVYWGKVGSKFFLMGFQGKRSKYDFYFRYATKEAMDASIEHYFAGIERTLEYKRKAKEANKGKLSSHAAAASEIRKLLKKEFPGIKFNVRSETFAGGDSVNISWADGPTERQVKARVKQFQYGHFDGMNDIYEYSNTREDIPQVKFVMTSRKLSYDAAVQIAREIKQKLGEKIKIEKNDYFGYQVVDDRWRPQFSCYGATLINRETVNRSF